MTARHYRRSEHVDHPPAQLYQLVCDIDRYSSFLPWCSRSFVHRQQDRVPGGQAPESQAPESQARKSQARKSQARKSQARKSQEIVATLEMSMGPMSQSFTTRNRLVPETEIEMTLIEGPFRQLHGLWRFTPEERGCRIDLSVDFEFSNRFLDLAFGPLFRLACESLIGAFRRRADEFRHNSCLPYSSSSS